MDKADGSGTILFNLAERDWSSEVLSALEIPPDGLPPTYDGPEITGQVSQAASEATGLAPGIPVVGGGGDQAAQAVGVGAVETGIIALTLGTSGVVFATTPAALIEPQGRLHAFCHALPATWHFMGVMLSAGSLQWYRDTLASVWILRTWWKRPGYLPGSEGLLFLPYLTGERTPIPTAGAAPGLGSRYATNGLTSPGPCWKASPLASRTASR
jgi:xylulokinase